MNLTQVLPKPLSCAIWGGPGCDLHSLVSTGAKYDSPPISQLSRRKVTGRLRSTEEALREEEQERKTATPSA